MWDIILWEIRCRKIPIFIGKANERAVILKKNNKEN